MNKKYLSITLIGITLISLILFGTNSFPIKTNSSNDIENLKILEFIPPNNNFTFISSLKTNEINNYFKKNINNKNQQKINLLSKSALSYLGFDLRDKINNIYDGEFYLSIFDSKEDNKDILIIFKIKEKKDINDLLMTKNVSYKTNEIFEIKREGKLNLLSHITKTSDNYIICSSNKKLIEQSINIKNSQDTRIEKELISHYQDQIKGKKLLLISKDNYIETLTDQFKLNNKNTYYLSFINIQNEKLYLESSSIDLKNDNNFDVYKNTLVQIQTSQNLISSNKLLEYIDYFFHDIDLVHKNIIIELLNKLESKLFFSNESDKWLLGFNKSLDNINIIKNIKLLNNYNKDSMRINNSNYTVFSKNVLNAEDNKLIYIEEKPIFTSESEDLILISNSLSRLSDQSNYKTIRDNYLDSKNEDNNNIGSEFIKDYIIINKFSNNDFLSNLPLLNYINSLTDDQLNLNLNQLYYYIEQNIPEICPRIYLKTNLNFL